MAGNWPILRTAEELVSELHALQEQWGLPGYFVIGDGMAIEVNLRGRTADHTAGTEPDVPSIIGG